MNKQKYIEGRIKEQKQQLKDFINDINISFNQDKKYKMIKSNEEQIAICKCKNDKFYLFKNLICSNCFSEYTWDYDTNIEVVD